MKKQYQAPTIKSETFVPQEYVAACFTYRANLVCDYGKVTGWGDDGLNHGEPCAQSTVTVKVKNDIVTLSGTEGADKTHINLTKVDIPGVDQVSYVGQEFYNCTWESVFGSDTYKHKGSGEVTYFSRQANAS